MSINAFCLLIHSLLAQFLTTPTLLPQVSADVLSYYRNLQSGHSSKWLRDTRYKSAQLMHVQVRIAICVWYMCAYGV